MTDQAHDYDQAQRANILLGLAQSHLRTAARHRRKSKELGSGAGVQSYPGTNFNPGAVLNPIAALMHLESARWNEAEARKYKRMREKVLAGTATIQIQNLKM